MQLGKRGWLQQLLREVAANHRADLASQSYKEAEQLRSGREHARRYLRGILRESGRLFGTPSNMPHHFPDPETNFGINNL